MAINITSFGGGGGGPVLKLKSATEFQVKNTGYTNWSYSFTNGKGGLIIITGIDGRVLWNHGYGWQTTDTDKYYTGSINSLYIYGLTIDGISIPIKTYTDINTNQDGLTNCPTIFLDNFTDILRFYNHDSTSIAHDLSATAYKIPVYSSISMKMGLFNTSSPANAAFKGIRYIYEYVD